MSSSLRRALPFAVLAAVAAPTAAGADGVFGDLGADDTHAAGIEYLLERGLTNGCTPDAFCPTDPVTRQELATFLHHVSGSAPGVAPSVNADTVDGLDADDLRGAPGPAGPAGPTGPAGSIGAVTVVQRTVEVVENSAVQGHAECPEGTSILGGGVSPSARTAFFLSSSGPDADLDGWDVIYDIPGGGVAGMTFTVTAICAEVDLAVLPG